MRFPRVPGPRDVLTVAERTGDLVEQLIGTLPRVMALLDAAERIVVDLDALVVAAAAPTDVDRLMQVFPGSELREEA